jgi:hypothetical protein
MLILHHYFIYLLRYSTYMMLDFIYLPYLSFFSFVLFHLHLFVFLKFPSVSLAVLKLGLYLLPITRALFMFEPNLGRACFISCYFLLSWMLFALGICLLLPTNNDLTSLSILNILCDIFCHSILPFYYRYI